MNVTSLIEVKKSRKDHKCDFCWKVIPAGSSYTRNSGIWDGSVFAQPVCNDCYAHIEKCDECKDQWSHGDLSSGDVGECIYWTNERENERAKKKQLLEQPQ